MNILVVDDQYDLTDIFEEFFSEKGYRVFKAHNGKQALKILKLHKVDLLISDIDMPEMNGLELYRNIKSSLKTKTIPIILMSAVVKNLINIETTIKFYRDKIISKPVDLFDLNGLVESLLTNYIIENAMAS